MKERWKPVVGFEGLYEVSDWGRVRSTNKRILCHRKDGSSFERLVMGRVRKTSFARAYEYLPLSKAGKQYGRAVHRLVLESFTGVRPKGKQAAHLNGVPHDNRLVNLAWKTPTDNTQDKFKHGTFPTGEKNALATLSNEQVARIKELAESGVSQWSIGKVYGVSQQHISNILSGKRRKHG